MKKIHVIGLAFAAVFAFSMISASGASALTLWDECTTTAPVLEFQNNDCLLAGPPNSFGWQEITVLTSVDSLLTTLTLLSNGVTIDCEGSMDGSVGANGESEVTELLDKNGNQITAAKPVTCEKLAGSETLCTPPVVASPVNLPWSDQLVNANGSEPAGDLLTNSTGHGSPGWLVKCSGFLQENECTRADTILGVENLTDELEVDLTFNPAEKANCSVGGTGAGEVEGTVAILLVGTERALQAM